MAARRNSFLSVVCGHSQRNVTHTFKRLSICFNTYARCTVGQIRLGRPVCLTGIKMGASSGSGGAGGLLPFVNVFAVDLTTLAAARMACLAERCTLPKAGTKAVRLEVLNNRDVIRG